MAKYYTKVNEIEAVQLLPDGSLSEAPNWILVAIAAGKILNFVKIIANPGKRAYGGVLVALTDFMIKMPDGSIKVMKADAFHQIYKPSNNIETKKASSSNSKAVLRRRGYRAGVLDLQCRSEEDYMILVKNSQFKIGNIQVQILDDVAIYCDKDDQELIVWDYGEYLGV